MYMYKKIIIGFLLLGQAIGSQAQDVGTLLDQLAALRGYIVTTEKGYRLVEDGLHRIGDIRAREFNLHSAYFTSLSAVNPAVKNSPQVSVIVQLETSMLNQFASAMTRWQSSYWL